MENRLCDYGCGMEANYVLNNKKNCCKNSPNKCIEVRRKNSESIINAYKTGNKSIINNFGDNRGWAKDKNILNDHRIIGRKYKKFSDIFCVNSQAKNSAVRKLIIQNNLIEHDKCQGEDCVVLNQWLNKKITLELDHINGVNNDHRLENLRFLCPNCHSQTESFNRVKNSKLKRRKGINDAMIINEIKKGLNNHQICKKLDISLGNHKRINLIKIKLEKKCIKCNNKLKSIAKTGMCLECVHKSQRKVDRPPYLELLDMINKIGFVQTGKNFNVSDNAIRKWLKNYKSK